MNKCINMDYSIGKILMSLFCVTNLLIICHPFFLTEKLIQSISDFGYLKILFGNALLWISLILIFDKNFKAFLFKRFSRINSWKMIAFAFFCLLILASILL
jgi:hypothetical protein